MTPHRAGYAVLAGRPNVGKSTLLNELCGMKLAIVTPKPQTTRHRILGVVHRPDAQIVWIDTPGLYRPRNELGRRMVAGASAAVREADVVVLVVDATSGGPRADAQAIASLDRDRATILALNKVDLVHPKDRLLPLLSRYADAFPFASMVPISAKKSSGIDRLVDEVVLRLPEHPPYWGPDAVTDRPERFLVAELVREAAFVQLGEELPYSVAVTIDRFEEGERLSRISATLHVERESQKRIAVGKGGARIKAIGTAARAEIEKLLGVQVHLELFVRVTDGWTADRTFLDDLEMEGQ